MTLTRLFASLAFASLGFTALVSEAASAAPPPHLRAIGHSDPAIVETARIHRHFDSVLVELDSRDVSALSSAQRTNRSSLKLTLRAYDARGIFPHNYDFTQPTPYFIDRKTGTLCAVAHLLESTGRRDIADRVARTDNNVWVASLASDTAFTAWLDTQGITLDEAARIQVPYDGGPSGGTVVALVGTSLLTVGTGIGTTIWNGTGNADGHSRAGNNWGLTTGILTGLIGSSLVLSGDNRSAETAGYATAAVGALGTVFAIRGIRLRPHTLAAKRDAERAATAAPGNAREPMQASFAPIIPMGRNTATGVSLNIRF